MKKIISCVLMFSFVIAFTMFLTACNNHSDVKTSEHKIKIGDVPYTSLTEAVDNAKSGDTIKIYHDVRDKKNVIIDKPLNIEGVLSSNQVKPKYYGSLTINLGGSEDSTSVENIELIHAGVNNDGKNNDTTIGINLIDGGLTLKSSVISLDDNSTPSQNATGVVISRKANSENIMPIVIKGNEFGNYKASKDTQSGALLVLSNKHGVYQNLNLNSMELSEQNSFASEPGGNQYIYISYATTPSTYDYLVTSSADEFINTLTSRQSKNGSTIKVAPNSLSITPPKDIVIDEKSNVTIDGDTPFDMQNINLYVKGTLTINSPIENANISRNSDTASIVVKENSMIENASIK